MTQPDLDNITATDLSDDERLSTLYLVRCDRNKA